MVFDDDQDELDAEEWSDAEKSRWLMRNGHQAERPWESREEHNLRVHGFGEDDFW